MTPNSPKAWFLGVRPNSFSGSAIPVLVASAMAYTDGCLNWQIALLCLLTAIFLHIVTNLVNEYCDFHNGMDDPAYLSPDRMYARGYITPKAMKWGIIVAGLCACISGCALMFFGNWQFIILTGVICLIAALAYTAGPFPLAYNGLGDIAVVLFFGVVPACATYYLQSGEFTPDIICVSIACGLIVDTMLVLNNYRDRDADKANGKRSIVVILGPAVGRWGYLLLGLLAIGLCLLMLQWGRTWAALLPIIYLVPFLHTWRRIMRIDQGPELDLCFAATARNILIFGVLLTVGILLG